MLTIQVLSSNKTDRYTVTISGSAGKIKLHCNCAAGQLGQQCRHRLDLLSGEIFSHSLHSADDLKQIHAWLCNSPLEAELKQLHDLEKQSENIKKALKIQKKKIGQMMDKGH